MTKTTIVCDWCGAEGKPCVGIFGLDAHTCSECEKRPDVAKVVVLGREAAKRAERAALPDWARQHQGMQAGGGHWR
jgi:hypothetical protein